MISSQTLEKPILPAWTDSYLEQMLSGLGINLSDIPKDLNLEEIFRLSNGETSIESLVAQGDVKSLLIATIKTIRHNRISDLLETNFSSSNEAQIALLQFLQSEGIEAQIEGTVFGGNMIYLKSAPYHPELNGYITKLKSQHNIFIGVNELDLKVPDSERIPSMSFVTYSEQQDDPSIAVCSRDFLERGILHNDFGTILHETSHIMERLPNSSETRFRPFSHSIEDPGISNNFWSDALAKFPDVEPNYRKTSSFGEIKATLISAASALKHGDLEYAKIFLGRAQGILCAWAQVLDQDKRIEEKLEYTMVKAEERGIWDLNSQFFSIEGEDIRLIFDPRNAFSATTTSFSLDSADIKRTFEHDRASIPRLQKTIDKIGARIAKQEAIIA